MLRWLVVSAALVCAQSPVTISQTPDGVRFGYLGAKPSAPRPTVLFLAGAVEDSLTQPHYRPAIETLGQGVLFVTLDLPAHGAARKPAEPGSLEGWRYRLDRGEPLVEDLTRRAKALLDHLVRDGFSDSSKIAAFGVSRGGFMALHLAAAEPRLTRIAAFAPVTDLLVLREFWGMQDPNRAHALAAARIADRIHDRAVWMMIGGTDDRVGSGKAIEFAQRFIESARAQGTSPNLELHVQPSEGHRVPDGSYERAARWLMAQWGM